MATTISSAALVPVTPVVSNSEGLALATTSCQPPGGHSWFQR
jgi:hypothetical protein